MAEVRRTLAQWLQWQQSVHARGIDLTLSRVATVARRLGVDRPACPVVTVGGTNGKGSVVAHLAALLAAAGFRTGVFTSPHLLRYNERIRVDGAEVADAELVAAFERIETARAQITLTYFEYSTLAALLIFAERAVGVEILEVGLGGRLDATNIIDPSVAVVCSVGLDHRDWLGDTLEDIGREKAGIFRPGRPAVLGSPDMPHSLFATLEALGAKPYVAERDFKWSIGGGHNWNYQGRELSLHDLPPSALAGAIQYRNAATALAAIEALSVAVLSPAVVAAGLRAVQLQGRFQIVPGPTEWILDVAHNEPAARVLAGHLAARANPGRTFAVVSILADKDTSAIANALAPVIDRWIICGLDEPRGLTAQELAVRWPLESSSYQLARSVREGCELAASLAQPGDRIVACGSFFVVSAALQWLRL